MTTGWIGLSSFRDMKKSPDQERRWFVYTKKIADGYRVCMEEEEGRQVD
jgi:hypothetical protein